MKKAEYVWKDEDAVKSSVRGRKLAISDSSKCGNIRQEKRIKTIAKNKTGGRSVDVTKRNKVKSICELHCVAMILMCHLSKQIHKDVILDIDCKSHIAEILRREENKISEQDTLNNEMASEIIYDKRLATIATDLLALQPKQDKLDKAIAKLQEVNIIIQITCRRIS